MSEKTLPDRAVLVRMPGGMANALDAAAVARGMSTAALVRLTTAEAIGATAMLGTRRSPPRARRPVVDPNETEMRLLVRRLGQLTETVANLPGSADQAETLALVREAVRQAIVAVQSSCR